MRLLICAGGTGGGVYPALAVLKALTNWNEAEHPPAGAAVEVEREIRPYPPAGARQQVEVLWVGGIGGMEVDLVKRTGIPFEAISAAGVHGVGLRSLPGNLWQLGRGYLQARRVLGHFCPDVLLFTGGYVAVPMTLAGRKVPKLLYVPDIEPGLALKTLARFADHIALTADDSRAYFPGRRARHLTVTGYPTRPELRAWSAGKARQELGLSNDLPVLLVFGGSTGARSINRAVLAALPQLLAEMQVVHISGQLDWPEVQSTLSILDGEQSSRYRAFPYLHTERMGAALSAANLALSRAGASTLGEFPLFGLPAILVPYPYAWRYQQVNASHLAQRGAAVIVQDADLPARLVSVVQDLIRDEQRRTRMGDAMRALARPAAAETLAELLVQLAVKRYQERM